MYPAHLFSLFPPFPREDKVFVAMSFDPRFDPRWKNVIAPAIVGGVLRNAKPFLEPVRVDTRKISDSILTEILSGISNSRLVLADISTIGYLDKTAVRNGNVMYEVGLAQAVRLPEEVLLFRSDDDSLLFDTANIRVNTYAPDDAPENARAQVADTIIAALREIDLRKHIAVKKAAEALDYTSWWVLAQSQSDDGVPHPPMQTMGQALGNAARAAAIARLLEVGALKTSYLKVTPEVLAKWGDSPDFQLLKYECTEFGKSVFHEGAARIGLLAPELQRELEQHIENAPAKE